MPPERVAHILTHTCHSLEEAHQAGLVHRDLKPANLMLCRYGLDEDFLKVVDFGLAKDEAATDSAMKLTAEKTILGTAAYLAPESLQGSAHVDGRADLYALGCIGYFLLTGKLLYDYKQPAAMARAHIREAPPNILDSDPSVPADLAALIAACLLKNRDQRPQTAREIADQLRAMELAPQWTEACAKAWWQQYWEKHPKTEQSLEG
jgi:serine/threonine-protein kinase